MYSGRIISDATEATKVIKEVIFEESERRGRLLAEARVANIVEYNKKVAEKLAPIVVVIDEFADLADQLETTKEKNAFYKPVQRIAQLGEAENSSCNLYAKTRSKTRPVDDEGSVKWSCGVACE